MMTWLTVILPSEANSLCKVLVVAPGLYQLGLMVWRTFFAAQTDGPAAQRVLLRP